MVSARRLPIYIFLKTLCKLISSYIVQPGLDLEACATCVQLEAVKLATTTDCTKECFVTNVVNLHNTSEHVVQLSILPYEVRPRAFLEICAGCVLLEAVNLSKFANVAQNGVARRLPRRVVFNSLYNLT